MDEFTSKNEHRFARAANPFDLRLLNLLPDQSESSNDSHDAISRRRFLALAAAATILGALKPAEAAEKSVNGIPYRTLGKTGEHVSAIGLGGYHIGAPEEKEGLAIIRTAVDSGINFMDNCWDYNDGDSEVRMGKALKNGYRDKVFLMTKIDGRDSKTAAKQIDESLRRLQTDRIDLVQFHEVIRMTDPDRTFEAGGSMEAMLAAKKAGKLRYIGFTGHKNPKIHLKMLETAKSHGFAFDTVQMPLNVMDAHYESFEKLVLPVLLREKIGILGMKPMGGGVILKSKAVTAVECLHYALSLPADVVITGCDSKETLQQALDVVRSFKPLSEKERLALLEKTAPLAMAGDFELYKTSIRFDGTTKHPQWMG